MKTMFCALLVMCVVSCASASVLARDCAGGHCRVDREARVERSLTVTRERSELDRKFERRRERVRFVRR